MHQKKTLAEMQWLTKAVKNENIAVIKVEQRLN